MIEGHFAMSTYLLRWMREKRGGEEKLSSELLHAMEINMHATHRVEGGVIPTTIGRHHTRRLKNTSVSPLPARAPHIPTTFFNFKKTRTLLIP
jgi:hypothetical protein